MLVQSFSCEKRRKYPVRTMLHAVHSNRMGYHYPLKLYSRCHRYCSDVYVYTAQFCVSNCTGCILSRVSEIILCIFYRVSNILLSILRSVSNIFWCILNRVSNMHWCILYMVTKIFWCILSRVSKKILI